MNKVIWTCWFQGRKNASDLVERCLASWETLNPDWEFYCLDAETIGRYIDLGDHIDLQSQTITAASLSDILRLFLLHEYGGVWVDATLYCNQPLDKWLPLAMGTGFFAFSKPAPDRPLSSWFIAAAPGNMLLAKWVAQVRRYWCGRRQSDDYFWLHHQFGMLCSMDKDASAAWEKVPKISSDGPHAIQQAGMYESAESAGRGIDWTTPVFKLTHRLDEDAYRSGCLVHHVLHRRNNDTLFRNPLQLPKWLYGVWDFLLRSSTRVYRGLFASVLRAFRGPSFNKVRDEAHIAGLKVSTENLGDHIQILAGLQLLKRLGLVPEQWIDRDNEIATAALYNDQRQFLGILLNGWFKTNPTEWPPHPRLTPIYLGFHIRLFQAPTLVSTQALEHYRQFGPIGCRDRYTLSLLKSHGVDAFLSHCLSLTLPRRLDDPDNQTETFIVSRDRRILDYLPSVICSGRFVSHYSGTTDFSINMQRATELLMLYRSRAKIIITTMLHCALPAIAMGIPVVVFFPPSDGALHHSDQERFSSLQEIIRVFHPNEATRVDWQGYTANVSSIKLALIDHMFEMAQKWGRLPGTRIGPIAPASALPVPSVDQKDDYMNETACLNALTSASSADRQRWGNPSSYKSDWNDRAKLAATLIPNGAHVLEIGVGIGNLKRLIQHRCVYVGADLEPLSSDTISLDLDNDPLPHGHYDCIVALGVFEYLHRSQDAAARIALATDHVVLSYCCIRGNFPHVITTRSGRGWVNHFSEGEFTTIFALQGLDLVSRTTFNVTDDFEQIIFDFQRTVEV